MKRSLLVSLAVVALSCQKREPPRPEPERVPAASAAPTAAANASASASSGLPVAPVPAKIADATLALHVVASHHQDLPPPDAYIPYDTYAGPRPLRIHALRDRMLVTGFDLALYGLEGGKLRMLDELPPQMLRRRVGADSYHFASSTSIVTHVKGRYPDELYFTVDGAFTDGARIGGAGEGSFVKKGDRYEDDPLPLAASAWTSGKTLVLLGDAFLGGASAPRRTQGKACATRIKAEHMAALPTGEVLVPGGDCDAGGKLALERWAPGSRDGVVVPLPAPEGKIARALIAANERDGFVLASIGGAGFLARVGDAKDAAPAALELPSKKPVTDAGLADDGCLWILLGEGAGVELFRRDKAGVFTRAVFPAPAAALQPLGLYAESCEAVYVAGATSDEDSVIVSTRPGEILHLADAPKPASSAAPEAGAEAGADPKPLAEGCSTPFVILFALGKTAPENYDYPATRDALSGWPERTKFKFVEYEFKGARTLGARAPDAAAARSLVERVREKVKGSKPVAACFQPGGVRRDLSLGG
jgi:hypothetical protein